MGDPVDAAAEIQAILNEFLECPPRVLRIVKGIVEERGRLLAENDRLRARVAALESALKPLAEASIMDNGYGPVAGYADDIGQADIDRAAELLKGGDRGDE